MRKERLAKGWTILELAAQTKLAAPHLGRIENGKRPPTLKIAKALDGVFPHRKGYFVEWVEETQDAPEIPSTFRSWGDYEEKTRTLRDWTPSIFTGLLQTSAYARPILESLGVPPHVVEARLTARTERQKVLERVNSWFIVDELAVYRQVGTPETMAAQLRHTLELASAPKVTLQVLPAVHHNANASGLLLADTAAWCEHLAAGYVFNEERVLTALAARWDMLRSECLKASESLAFLERMTDLWSTGESPLTRIRRAGTA